jgi:lipoprotein-releasing system permease protein
MSGLVGFLGLRTLRGRSGTARYLRGSVVGIALSLVPLLVVMEVSTGMIEGITARLLEAGTGHIQAALPTATGVSAMEELAREASALPGVVAAVAERQGTALLVSEEASAGVTLRCIAPGAFRDDRGLASTVTATEGSLDLSAAGSILLSGSLARTLGVRTGGRLSVLTASTAAATGLPRITPVTVAGIYETGYQELDKLMAFAPLAAAPRMLSPRESRALIAVKVADPFADMSAVIRALRRALPGDSRLATWQELEFSRLASFRTTRALLVFIMALVVLVAAVNVSSSVLMIVHERRLDIGILKAVGASPSALSAAFLAAGSVTGILGTALGIALGLLVAVNVNGVIAAIQAVLNAGAWLVSVLAAPLVPSAAAVRPVTVFNSAYYLQEIPIRISGFEVAAAAFGTILLSALASWIPARRATAVRPLEILRKV